ncbi:MAG: hypothetical protein QM763_17970 [Agriterribacter sp.]
MHKFITEIYKFRANNFPRSNTDGWLDDVISNGGHTLMIEI